MAVGENLEKPWRRGSVIPVVGQLTGWVIRLCGPMGVERDGRSLGGAPPGRRGRLFSPSLSPTRDRDGGRPELIALLWPERPPAAADTALSALLSKLRRTLGEGALA